MSKTYSKGSVPIAFAARIFGKDPAWVRAGIIGGWLPIGEATRGGRRITNVDDISSAKGRINYYISPKLFFEFTGISWEGKHEHANQG